MLPASKAACKPFLGAAAVLFSAPTNLAWRFAVVASAARCTAAWLARILASFAAAALSCLNVIRAALGGGADFLSCALCGVRLAASSVTPFLTAAAAFASRQGGAAMSSTGDPRSSASSARLQSDACRAPVLRSAAGLLVAVLARRSWHAALVRAATALRPLDLTLGVRIATAASAGPDCCRWFGCCCAAWSAASLLPSLSDVRPPTCLSDRGLSFNAVLAGD
jgi:hypothetical protein